MQGYPYSVAVDIALQHFGADVLSSRPMLSELMPRRSLDQMNGLLRSGESTM